VTGPRFALFCEVSYSQWREKVDDILSWDFFFIGSESSQFGPQWKDWILVANIILGSWLVVLFIDTL